MLTISFWRRLKEQNLPLQYRRLKRFGVLEIGGMKQLVSRGGTVKCCLPVEEIYDVIEAAHLAVGLAK
jgi:hypothetical protein